MAEFYENKDDCGTAMSFFKRFHFVSMVLKDKQNTYIALNRLGNLSMKNNLVTQSIMLHERQTQLDSSSNNLIASYN